MRHSRQVITKSVLVQEIEYYRKSELRSYVNTVTVACFGAQLVIEFQSIAGMLSPMINLHFRLRSLPQASN